MEPDPSTVGEQQPPRGGRLRRTDARELAAIFAGGFIGALARAGLAQQLTPRADQWPWATFAVNMTAALALGYFATRLREHTGASPYLRPFLTTGFCGALSTFSTMMVELLRMLDAGELPLAGAYAAASLAGGLAALSLGSRLARRLA